MARPRCARIHYGTQQGHIRHQPVVIIAQLRGQLSPAHFGQRAVVLLAADAHHHVVGPLAGSQQQQQTQAQEPFHGLQGRAPASARLPRRESCGRSGRFFVTTIRVTPKNWGMPRRAPAARPLLVAPALSRWQWPVPALAHRLVRPFNGCRLKRFTRFCESINGQAPATQRVAVQ